MDKIEVTQADRDAAAHAWYKQWGKSHMEDRISGIHEGNADNEPIVQAFAAHRLATRTDATPVAWMYHHDGDLEHGWQRLKFERRLQTYEGMTCSEEDAGVIETPLFSHPPATDVAALVEAAKANQHYGCPVCSGDCGSANPPVMACPMQSLSAALAPFTKGQP